MKKLTSLLASVALLASFQNLNAQSELKKIDGVYLSKWEGSDGVFKENELVVVYGYESTTYDINLLIVNRNGMIENSSIGYIYIKDGTDIKDQIKSGFSPVGIDSAIKIANSMFLKDSILKDKEMNEILADKNPVRLLQSIAVDVSEYTDGTGYETVFRNQSKKKIKYISFTLLAYNPVNDVIGTKTVKGVGPIGSGEIATYKWDYLWFTDLVEKVKVSKIVVEYMDGTFATMVSPKTNRPKYLFQ
jgi:hypothetical protein